jgi:NitT/TauT family transport system permease protein
MAATICFFPAIVNGLRGFRSVQEEALDLMGSLAASRRDTFFKLRLPASLPFLFSAFKISSSLSVVGAVVAEMAGADSGIGYLILVSSYRNDTASLFAATIAISIGAIAFFGVIALTERRLLFWAETDEGV